MQPLTASTPLKYQEDNPKQEGCASYARYEAYKGAQTLEAFLRCGGTLGDLRHDEKKNYVEVNADVHAPAANTLVRQLKAALKAVAAPNNAPAAPAPAEDAVTVLDLANCTTVVQPVKVVADRENIMIYGHRNTTTGPHLVVSVDFQWLEDRDDPASKRVLEVQLGNGVYVKKGDHELLYGVLWSSRTSCADGPDSYTVDCVRIKEYVDGRLKVEEGKVWHINPLAIVAVNNLNQNALNQMKAAMENAKVHQDLFLDEASPYATVKRFVDARDIAYVAPGGRREQARRLNAKLHTKLVKKAFPTAYSEGKANGESETYADALQLLLRVSLAFGAREPAPKLRDQEFRVLIKEAQDDVLTYVRPGFVPRESCLDLEPPRGSLEAKRRDMASRRPPRLVWREDDQPDDEDEGDEDDDASMENTLDDAGAPRTPTKAAEADEGSTKDWRVGWRAIHGVGRTPLEYHAGASQGKRKRGRRSKADLEAEAEAERQKRQRDESNSTPSSLLRALLDSDDLKRLPIASSFDVSTRPPQRIPLPEAWKSDWSRLTEDKKRLASQVQDLERDVRHAKRATPRASPEFEQALREREGRFQAANVDYTPEESLEEFLKRFP